MYSEKLGVLIRSPGSGVDVRTTFEFQEWQARGGRRLTDRLRCKRASIVEHFIGFAIQQDSPVKRTPPQCLQLKYFCRAVVCERVVPGGVIVKLVGEGRVVEQEIAGKLWRCFGVVEIKILAMTIVGAKTHKITLVAHDRDKGELAEESENAGVLLSHVLPGFDREGDGIVLQIRVRGVGTKIEADDGVGDPGRSPIIHKEIDTPDPVEVDCASQPLAAVIKLGSIVAAANVMKGQLRRLDVGIGDGGDVGLPVAFIGWRNAQPPGKNDGKTEHRSQQPRDRALEEDQPGHDRNQIHDCGKQMQTTYPAINEDRQNRPR